MSGERSDSGVPTNSGKQKIGLVQVKINGKMLPIKGFVQDFIGLTILGMLSSLHGAENPDEVEIKIKLTPEPK